MAAHPDELKERLNAEQIAGWMAFGVVEPYGPSAIERHAAIVAQTVEATATKTPRRLTEFMPSQRGRVWTEEEIALQLAGRFHGSGR